MLLRLNSVETHFQTTEWTTNGLYENGNPIILESWMFFFFHSEWLGMGYYRLGLQQTTSPKTIGKGHQSTTQDM